MFSEVARYGTDAAQKGLGRDFSGYHPMMWGVGPNSGVLWVFGFLWAVTWILLIIALVALIRWVWKKGDEVGKRERR